MLTFEKQKLQVNKQFGIAAISWNIQEEQSTIQMLFQVIYGALAIAIAFRPIYSSL